MDKPVLWLDAYVEILQSGGGKRSSGKGTSGILFKPKR